MKSLKRVFNLMVVLLVANCYLLYTVCSADKVWIIVFIILTLVCFARLNIFASVRKYPDKRIRTMSGGAELLALFIITTFINTLGVVSVGAVVPGLLMLYPFYIHCLVVIIVESTLFWNGIIRVYCTSVQLGVKIRVIGILVGWIPIANLIALFKILKTVYSECDFETKKAQLNKERRHLEVCKTKYPLLFVHGVFFRDIKYFNYWGRIPGELEANGAKIFYGKQQSASSVEDSAEELVERIKDVVNKTGCEKVNIIAHSKGGLDARYAISCLGADEYVASLTTINTPHRGCIFAEYLLNKAPEKFKNTLANNYNQALKKLGDQSPDFLAAVTDLTASRCAEINSVAKDKEGVLYQSVASKSNNARSGKFPLNISYPLVRHFDGANDGLVSVESAKWGTNFTLLAVKGKRGITHADVIDLNRENINGFDVREFYVQLAGSLKTKDF